MLERFGVINAFRKVRIMANSKRGLTLVEVILALAIIGIISVIVFPVFSSGLAFVMRAGSITSASFYVSGQIELSLNHRDQDLRKTDLLVISLDGVNIIDGANIEPDLLLGHIETISDGDISVTYFLPAR